MKKGGAVVLQESKFHVTVNHKLQEIDYEDMDERDKEEVGKTKEWHAAGVHHVYTLFTHRNLV